MSKSKINDSMRLAWIYPVALAVAIAVVSSRSQVAGPEIPHFDKLVHFLVYGLLATLIVRIAVVRSWPGLGGGWAVVLAALYGAVDEWHQSIRPGRFVELADWLADSTGALLAVILYLGWTRYRAVLERPVCFRRNRRVEIRSASVPDCTP